MKRIFYIKGEQEYDAGQLVLSLRIGEKYIGFSISNNTKTELVQLGWFIADELDEKHIDELYHTYPELKKSYSKTIIGFDSPMAILVPDKFYRQDYSQALLKTMYSEQDSETFVTEPVSSLQLHTLYKIPLCVQQRLNQYFPAAVSHHAYAVSIDKLREDNPSGSFFIDFRGDDFTVLVKKESSVLLFQTFQYATPADVIYYLLKICQEFDMSSQEVQLEITGLIEQNSALYKEIYQYFMHVHFRNASWQLPAHAEDEYPSHFFTFFNDLSLCES